jgi:alkanesulfonate monooxygenase SsuD/methylene tetrahydromethanopterin reductase-like flavin-dependent oxidoreductase (luciferase family)
MGAATSVSVGLSLASMISPAALSAAYRQAERGGFGELWVHEDYFFHGGIAAAANALHSTQHIPIGIGVVASVVRHPVVTAMEIATLAGAHPGRLRVGIGHGASHAMRQLGLQPKSPLQALREAITSVRGLLAGQMITQSGVFAFDQVQLAHPVAEEIPLYAGVIGPKSLALSGEIADGTVISVMSGPKYVAHARRITTEAAQLAGRERAHALPTLTFCFVDTDAARARLAARGTLAMMLALGGPDILTNVYGIDEQLRDMIARGGLEVIEAEMPDEWIDWFAAAGDPDRCVERIRELRDAGSTSVVLTLTDGATVASTIDLLTKEVLPRL